MNSLIQLSEVDMMKTKNNKNRPYKVDGLRDVEMVFQRRIAEARIFFETFLAALRALQLTFGEAAEAVGTLRGFPLRGGRRGLRHDIINWFISLLVNSLVSSSVNPSSL